MLNITIITLFPEVLKDFFNHSIIKRAQKQNKVKINYINPREFTTDKHKTIDDRPFGGGAGMLMLLEPIVKAIEKAEAKFGKAYKILLTPQGKLWNQETAEKIIKNKKEQPLILICGHYEGIDARIEHFIDCSISIGEYVLSGGEAACIVLVDSLVRLIPKVLNKKKAVQEETFMNIDKKELVKLTNDPILKSGKYKLKNKIKLIEYPQYTRPEKFQGLEVPKILLSGDHKKIRNWQLTEAWKKTKLKK